MRCATKRLPVKPVSTVWMNCSVRFGSRGKVALCLGLVGLSLPLFDVLPAIAQNNLFMTIQDVDNSGLIRSNGQFDIGGNASALRRVGSSTNPDQGLAPIFLFPLPGEAILTDGDAAFQFNFTGTRLPENTDYNTDVYGLGYISDPTIVSADWYYGAPPLDQRTRADLGTGTTGTVTRIIDDFLTPGSNVGRYETGPSTEVKSFLQSLYDDGAIAGDFAVIRLNADQFVDNDANGRNGTGYNVGIDNNGNRPYNPAQLHVGIMADAADTFGGGTGLVNDPIFDYQSGYGFVGNWQAPSDPFAARATIGRPTFFEPDQTEPITVTTALGTFDGGFTGARITGDTGFINSPLRRELAMPADDDVYFRYIIRAERGFDSDDLIGLWLDDTEGGISTDHTQDGVMLGIRNGGEIFGSIDGVTTAVAATINEAEDNLLIGRLYEASAGSGLNMLDFWLNPNSESESPLGTVDFGSNGFSAVSHIGFMTTATTEGPAIAVDDAGDFYLVDAFALAGTAAQIGFVNPTAPLPGDVNGDGIADQADFEIIRKNFLMSVTERFEGDLTGDGLVGAADFREWKNFRSAGAGSFAELVPEPTSWAIAMIGIVVAAGWGRRRK